MGKHETSPETGGEVIAFRSVPRPDDGPLFVAHLFKRFGPLVNRLVWRIMGAGPDHNDIVQDVFANVLESVGRFDGDLPVEQWVTAIAVNTIKNELRKKKVRRILRLVPDPGSRCWVAPDAYANASLRRFYDWLDALPADDRILFVLKYVEGHEVSEIASTCRMSLSSVARRLARARSAFFEQTGFEELLGPQRGGDEQ